MTNDQWLAECVSRIAINEGLRCEKYIDSMGLPTIGVGYNLTRGVAPLIAVGVPNPQAVCAGTASITQEQAYGLLRNDLTASISYAQDSLPDGIFDSLTDARRFVVVDLVYNLGCGMWLSFQNTRARIAAAQEAKHNNKPNAHQLFVDAGDALASSAYYQQTGNRAKRNVAMLISGVWCDPNGDGSDIPIN